MAGNETLFEFVLRYLARRLAGLAGRTGQADRALTEPERSPSAATVWPNYRANEKESPSKCLLELHLTEREISTQDAVLVVLTGGEFSMT